MGSIPPSGGHSYVHGRPPWPPGGRHYTSYLRLEEILKCQSPITDTHDEMLFIMIHQISELWIKLCLFELESAQQNVMHDRLNVALKMMERAAAIQNQLIQSWEVLATITPPEYAQMRQLSTASGGSGLQSVQYRLLEFLLGNKNPSILATHERDPQAQAILETALHRPGIYDEALKLLARRGFAIPEAHLNRDVCQPYRASPAVEDAWKSIYARYDEYWDLYVFAEKLVDLEYRVQLWRCHHLKTVARVIGFKPGSGGTTGVPYLARVMDQVFFSRAAVGSREALRWLARASWIFLKQCRSACRCGRGAVRPRMAGSACAML